MRGAGAMRRTSRRWKAGWVELPFAFERKSPRAAWSLEWHDLFAAVNLSVDPTSERCGRWRLHESTVQKSVTSAARRRHHPARDEPCVPPSLRDASPWRTAYDIRTVQTPSGDSHPETTMINAQVVGEASRGVLRVRSPHRALAGREASVGRVVGARGPRLRMRREAPERSAACLLALPEVEPLAVPRIQRSANGNGQVRSVASACEARASRLASIRTRSEAISSARAERASMIFRRMATKAERLAA